MPVAWPSQTALSFGKSVGGCLIVALLGRLLVALLRRRLALALHRPSPILAPKQHTVLKSAGSVHSSLVEASSTRNREPCTSSPAQEGPKQRAPIVVSSQKASVVDAGPAVTAAPTAAAAPLAVAPAPLGPTALALSQSRAGPVLLARVCMVKPGAVLQSLGSNTSSNTTNGSSSLSTTADTELMSDSGGGAIGGVAPVIAHIMETPRDLAGGTGCSPHRSGRSPQVQVRRYVGRTRLQRTAIKVHGVEPSQVPDGWQARVESALQQQGLKLEAAYLRSGCCELVVDTVVWEADGDGDDGTNGDDSAASVGLAGLLLSDAAAAAVATASEPAADAGTGAAGSGDAADGTFPMLFRRSRSRSSLNSRSNRDSDAPRNSRDGSSANVDIGALIRALQLPYEGDVEYGVTYGIDDGSVGGGDGGESFDAPASPADAMAAAGGAGAGADTSAAAVALAVVGGKDAGAPGDGAATAHAASGVARSGGGAGGSGATCLDWCTITSVRPRVLCRQGPLLIAPSASHAASQPDCQEASPPSPTPGACLSVELCLRSQGDLSDQFAANAAAATPPPQQQQQEQESRGLSSELPELLVRSQGCCLPLTVSLRAPGSSGGSSSSRAVMAGEDDGTDVAQPPLLLSPPPQRRCALTAEVGLQALPELPGLLLLEARMPHQARASVVPVLLVDDPRVAAEVGDLADSWQGAAAELRDVLLDLGCFTHHVHRAAGCLLTAALDESALPEPGSPEAEAAAADAAAAAFDGVGGGRGGGMSPRAAAAALAGGVGVVLGGVGAGRVTPPKALSPQLRTRLVDLGAHLLSWFDDAGCWPHTAVWLEVALALVESLPTEDLAQQQQQQSLVVQQAQQHFAPAARLPVPPLPAAPVPAAVSAPVPLATLTAAAGAAGRATAVEVEAAVEAEPAELEAADAAALAAAAAAADAEDYDTWRTAFSTRLIRQMHLLVLCLYIAITARSWSRRGDLQPASATAATAGAIAATAGATAAGAAAGAAAGEDTVWSWLQLLRDLAPSLVAVAPVLAPAAAWPVLRRRPDGGGAPWRALVRRCMAARHVAHLAAGVAVGWLAAAPRLPAVNDYHLGPAVFLGDGVMYLGTALVPLPAAAVLAVLRVPVYVRMWAAMGATFAPAYAWVRAALVSGLALATNAALHVFMEEMYRRRRLRRQQDKR
ncbi:hypothetical protein CHLRE_12g533850v5 [Chlamydomonas reinhardtii]|uniref:Uncharacterized protein n=1 Tax=Chlamydomonas reinhardtii TaxID=3055 RepID=A0A2K3D500_CHLRE|nr:uncharacterized protein CHLRE_12g533850v5 [Chlamydomonas reinhardtii]PNW75612.1 hypothetical protein CHLRE_12g533850v5 [Chlamydomonas reinhardtii]